jgi:hypothetical protein
MHRKDLNTKRRDRNAPAARSCAEFRVVANDLLRGSHPLSPRFFPASTLTRPYLPAQRLLRGYVTPSTC